MSPPSTPIRAYHVRPKTANTPTQSRRVLTAPAINDGLKTGRDAVMSDLGPAVRRVPLTYFLSNLLPQLGYNFEEQLDAIQADLESKGAITNGRWSAFSIDPQDNKEQEDPTFKNFEMIVNAVVKSALEVEGTSATDGDQTTKFVWNPNCAPLCALRGTKSRPDGYWQFIVPTFPGIASDPDHVYWEDIVVPGEKKKRKTYEDINDNIWKLMWSFHQAMRDSPRRRFMFGYTVENYSMHLWFCSRKDMIVSESFNFVTEHKTLIHFILSITFAPASHLGFDPTITPVWNTNAGNNRQYEITVRSRDGTTSSFLTEQLISNIGAEAVRGRGTRVWKVRKLVDGVPSKDLMVLKDCWIDHDREREGDILDRLRSSAQTDSHKTIFSKHFLTVNCHGDVYVDSQLDNTKSLLRQDTDIPEELGWYQLKHAAPKSGSEHVTMPPVGRTPVTEQIPKAEDAVEYDEKTHYRIVFNEVATGIDELTSMRMIFVYLSEVLIALWTMHKCGWVHRDVSVANILFIPNRGAIITDLEYAQEVNKSSRGHLGRTGTAYFTPIEVEANQYLFEPPATKTKLAIKVAETTEEYLMLRASRARKGTTGQSSNSPEVHQKDQTTPQEAKAVIEFQYNQLHDLEAFWWLCSYLSMLRKVILQIGEIEDEAAISRQKSLQGFCHKIFEQQIARRDAFERSKKFLQGVHFLHPRLNDVGTFLEDFRALLLESYRTAENDLAQINHKIPANVHMQILGGMDDLLETLSNDDVELSLIKLDMVVPHPEPRPIPFAISYDTGVSLHDKHLQNRAPGEDVFGPYPGPSTSVATVSVDAEESTGAPPPKRAKAAPAIKKAYRLRTPAPRPSTPSDDGDAVGNPALVAASSMMSVVTTAGDISSVPVDATAGLSIASTTVPHPSSSSLSQEAGPSRQSSSRARTKGKGKGKGKEKEPARQPSRKPTRKTKPA